MQHRHEESDADGTRRGSYGYLDANGVYRKVHYIADKNGFRVKEIKSNEPGLEMKKNPADVGLREDNFIVGSSKPSASIPTDQLSTMRNINNQKVRGTFDSESRPHKIISPGSFIDNPDFARNHPEHVVRHPSFTTTTSHDFIPVQDSFPYPFVAKTPVTMFENNLQSSHSIPIYEVKGVKGRGWYPQVQNERHYPPRTASPPSMPPYEKPLPVFDPRFQSSNNRSFTVPPPYDVILPDTRKYYAPIYPGYPNPNNYRPNREPTESPPFPFESTRVKPVNDYGPTTPTYSTSGYMHPLQPVKPVEDHYRPPYAATSPNPPNYGPIPNTLDYQPTPPSRDEYRQYPGSLRQTAPYYSPPTTSSPPYLPYQLPPGNDQTPRLHTESPYISSSVDRPLQYLDGPGPGAIVGSSRMEPTVFYADENIDHEKLAHEVFNYVPDSRTGEPPTPPYGLGPPLRDSIEPSPSYPRPENSGRDKIASYYHAIKHAPGVSTTVKSDVPSVLLGIQSALGLEGISTQSNPNDIDSNYSPSHYPSYDQIVLLRKGLRKLIPILAKQSSSSPSSSSRNSRLSVSSSSRVEDKVKPVEETIPSLLESSRVKATQEPVKETSEEETVLKSPTTYQS